MAIDVVIAWDVNQDTLDGIKGGTINATVAQKPFTMGYIGLRSLDEIFHTRRPRSVRITVRMRFHHSRCLSIRALLW